jgi:hypothetical protein
LRTEVLDILLSRPAWTQALLAAVERGELPAGQIGVAHQQKLLALQCFRAGPGEETVCERFVESRGGSQELRRRRPATVMRRKVSRC